MDRLARLLLALLLGVGPVVLGDPDPAAPPAGVYDDADNDAAPLPPLDPGPASAIVARGPIAPAVRLEPPTRSAPTPPTHASAPRVPRGPPAG